MVRHKKRGRRAMAAAAAAAGFVAVATAGTTGPAAKPAGDASAPPRLSSADRTYLIQLIRKTLMAITDGRRPEPLSGVPPALAGPRCPVVVTLRRGGYVIALGQADGQGNLAESCRIAAINALRDDRTRTRLTAPLLKRLAVEVELIGPGEQLPFGLLDSRRLHRSYQPGLDGVAIRLGDRNALIRPSQIVALGFTTADAIRFVEGRLGLTAAELKRRRGQAICMRFRTHHFWQSDPDGLIVELRRGCALVRPEEVTAERLDAAIRQIARYLQDRQRPDGLFPYAYLPWADREEGPAPMILQAGAAWALARYSASTRDAVATSVARAVDALTKHLVSSNGSAYLKSVGQADRLGATAMLLLAATEIQPAKTYRTLCDRLAAAILTRQLPTGMMQTNFTTTRTAAPQDTDPGQALLALARYHLARRNAAAASAIESAFDHYAKDFTVSPSVAKVPWLTSAYAQVSAVVPDRRYVDFVFRMIDWLEPYQLSPTDCPSPLMHGGIDPFGHDLAGVTTALHMAAVADALALARRIKDNHRAARYEQALRWGTRFVLQLQFRPEECYYVRSRVETINGVRTTPWDHTLAIENCQLALIALIKARPLLFP